MQLQSKESVKKLPIILLPYRNTETLRAHASAMPMLASGKGMTDILVHQLDPFQLESPVILTIKK